MIATSKKFKEWVLKPGETITADSTDCYEVRSETKLVFRLVEQLFQFASCLPSSSRRLPRSSRRELLLFVSSRPNSSRRLPRSPESSSFCSTRGCRVRLVDSHIESSFFCSTRGCRVRLVDSPDQVIVLVATEFDSSTPEVDSS